MTERVKWGLLATGAIARTFASGVTKSQTGELLAAGSRTQEKADGFCKEFKIPRAYGSYDDLLADPDVQAVYISTPHPMHHKWCIQAIQAGKHVLVEKPIGMNHQEAKEMIDAARVHQVFLMEAYMTRCHPQIPKLIQLIRDGEIGEVRVINAVVSFDAGFNAKSRLWDKQLGGGAILDVGGYATTMARLIAGAAVGQPFADPIAVTGAGYLHPQTGADAWAVGTLAFENGIVATISCGVGVNQNSGVHVYGSKGRIHIPNAGAQSVQFTVKRYGQKLPQEFEIATDVTNYTLEADVCGQAIQADLTQAPAPAMTWADSLGNMRTQDQWRKAIGLSYGVENL